MRYETLVARFWLRLRRVPQSSCRRQSRDKRQELWGREWNCLYWIRLSLFANIVNPPRSCLSLTSGITNNVPCTHFPVRVAIGLSLPAGEGNLTQVGYIGHM